MKILHVTNIITAAALVLISSSCESNKKSMVKQNGDEVVKIRTPQQDTVNKQMIPEATMRTVEGTVEDVRQGKDGYTAKIKSADNDIYFVTISHANLNDPATFKSIAKGEMLKVSGDYWKLESDNQITVRQILN